jgi:hypothetical protein
MLHPWIIDVAFIITCLPFCECAEGDKHQQGDSG